MQPSGKAGNGRAVDRPLLRRRSRRRERRRCCGWAGRTSTFRRATRTTPSPIRSCCRWTSSVQAVQPHAHYRARDVRGEATLPDGIDAGRSLHIGDWDFRWQHVYRFVDAAAIAEGHDGCRCATPTTTPPTTRATRSSRRSARAGASDRATRWATCGFRCSRNDDRDLDRSRRASSGRRFWRKTSLGYEVEIEKHPDDAALHDDAALLNLELGRADGAVRHFSASLALKPDRRRRTTTWDGADGCATARRGGGRVPPRARDRSGLRERHNNLGSVLLSQRRFADAIAAYREVVRLQPASPAGFANLAAAYAADGQFARAVEAIDSALRLNPPEQVGGRAATATRDVSPAAMR